MVSVKGMSRNYRIIDCKYNPLDRCYIYKLEGLYGYYAESALGEPLGS